MTSATDAARRLLTHALSRHHLVLLALAGTSVALALIVRHEIFPALSWNRDEPVYLWQAELFRSGHTSGTVGGAPEFFQAWLTGIRDGRMFAQYTPGWAGMLAASLVLFGSPGAALPVSAAVVVLGTYAFARALGKERSVALLAAAVMTASPILILHSGIYIGYLFSLGLGLWFATFLLLGIDRSPWLLVAAGALLGAVFLTRPFDAPLWGLTLALYVVATRRMQWRAVVRKASWTALGAIPFVAAGLAFNHHLTGDFLEFPITVKDPLDTFGFGIRHIMPEWTPVDFTLWRAFRGTGRNLFFLPAFLFGSYVGLALAAGTAWRRRREASTFLLVGLMAVFPAAYFFFWGIYLSASRVTLTGPLYYVPLYAALSVLLADGLLRAWRRRRALGAALAVVLLVATVPFLWHQVSTNHDFSEAQDPWRESTQGLEGPALVFVDRSGPYLMHLNPFSANDRELDGPILWATDRGPENLDLIAARPGRVPYLQTTTGPIQDGSTEPPPVPTVTLSPVEVIRGSPVALGVRIVNPTDRPEVTTYLRVQGGFVSPRTVDTTSQEGATYEVELTVSADGAATVTDAVLEGRLGTLAIGVDFRDPARPDAPPRRVEQHLSYRVVGADVELLIPARGMRAVRSDGETEYRRAEVGDTLRIRSRPRAATAAQTT